MPLPLIVRALRQPEQLTRLAPGDWDLLLRQAGNANLTAALGALLCERGLLEACPAQVREHFAWWQVVARRHRQAVRYEVAMIAAALQPLGVPVILLKGAAYAMADLPMAAGRLFSDIDIMLPKAVLNHAEAALMLRGWVASHHDAYDQRYYRQWMHELPPMQNLRRGTVIDIHHAILPQTAAVWPDPDKLRGAAIGLAGSDQLQVFAPPDMLLHSAVHLFHEGEFEHGLRDLFDLHRLLTQFGTAPGFWEALPGRARELQVERFLFYALRYSSKLFGTAVPAQVMAAAAGGSPPRPQLLLMDALFERALLPQHASCAGALSWPARALLYLRGNWLRMPPLMLARHLFHKAFLAPRKTAAERRAAAKI